MGYGKYKGGLLWVFKVLIVLLVGYRTELMS